MCDICGCEVKQFWEGWQHIIPVNDLIEHENNVVTRQGFKTYPCPCNPRLDYENRLVIHAAMDRREVWE